VGNLVAAFDLIQPLALDDDTVYRIFSFLTTVIETQNGLSGFAPTLLVDADDTSRTLLALQRLGHIINPAPMVQKFEGRYHFKRYENERNPSFSANCNVLSTLIATPVSNDYAEQIQKILKFLLDAWASGKVFDKWNTSPQYSRMLMTEALVMLLQKYDAGQLASLPLDLVLGRIPLSLCNILLQTIATQQSDGSWNSSIEETSYGIMTLSNPISLPWNTRLRKQLVDRIAQAQQYMTSRYPNDESNKYLWVEKTMFQPSFLKTIYCALAMYSAPIEHKWSDEVTLHFNIPEKATRKMVDLLTALPIFKKSRLSCLDLIFVTAAHLSRFLRSVRHSVVQRDMIPMSEDKYLDYIAIIWVACNDIGKHVLPLETMQDMVFVSLLNYQIDELMECVVADLLDAKVAKLIADIQDKCRQSEGATSPGATEYSTRNECSNKRRRVEALTGNGVEKHEDQSSPEVLLTLQRFITYFQSHSTMARSPLAVQDLVSRLLARFLLAHIGHNKDNERLRKRRKHRHEFISETALHTYFDWLHSTGANDTSCTFSFYFFSTLISKPGKSCFDGARAGYFAQALARHLSAMCRQYNDYGSVDRDRQEANLNSLDFVEFRSAAYEVSKFQETILNGEGKGSVTNGYDRKSKAGSKEQTKAELMKIVEFERASMELACQNLSRAMESEQAVRNLKVLIDVTDTSGQIYVQRDIASKLYLYLTTQVLPCGLAQCLLHT
jgi:hypothetical protein